MGASVTPDGRWIWYAFRTGPWSYNAILPQYQLAVYDRDTEPLIAFYEPRGLVRRLSGVGEIDEITRAILAVLRG